MSLESLNSVGSYDFEEIKEDDESADSSAIQLSKKSYELFMSQNFTQFNNYSHRLAKEISQKETGLSTDFKTQKIAQDAEIFLTGFDYDVTANFTYEWGGSEDSHFEMGVSGQGYDNKGNHAEIEVKHDSDGTTSISASGGHSSSSSSSSSSSNSPEPQQ